MPFWSVNQMQPHHDNHNIFWSIFYMHSSLLLKMPHMRGLFSPSLIFSSKDHNNFSSCLQHLQHCITWSCIHDVHCTVTKYWLFARLLVFSPVDRSWPRSWPSVLRQLRLRRARQAQPHIWTYVSKSFMLLCISYGSTNFWVVSKEPILCMLLFL